MPDDGISIEVTGLKELQAKLADLSANQANAAIRKALRAGAEVEQAAIAEAAPINATGGGTIPEGALKNDITITMSRDDRGQPVAIVQPGKYTRHVARWVEYGHRLIRGGRSRLLENGKSKGPGSQIGTVEPHAFIRPAYESSRSAVAEAICTTLAEEVEKASSRNSRSNK
jgi:HK97 gp10 family phage protein